MGLGFPGKKQRNGGIDTEEKMVGKVGSENPIVDPLSLFTVKASYESKTQNRHMKKDVYFPAVFLQSCPDYALIMPLGV